MSQEWGAHGTDFITKVEGMPERKERKDGSPESRID